MAEQTFRSPGFFEKEIDLTQRSVEIEGIPAGVVGTSKTGPAFVPVTVGSFSDFERKFGELDSDYFGPYAVNEWLRNRTALTYVRVLGAGANNTVTDINNTVSAGTVKNAGFRIKGTMDNATRGKHKGTVQFIVAAHITNDLEVSGYPVFTDNDSFDTSTNIRIVRGMVMLASGARMEVLNHSSSYPSSEVVKSDLASIQGYYDEDLTGSMPAGTFKLIISSAAGSTFGNDDNLSGLRILTASLDPSDTHYIGNILNTNPDRFHAEQHLLYADFPVEREIAQVVQSGSYSSVALVSGSSGTSGATGDTNRTYRDAFGSFDTRYQTARTTAFISQPYGKKEYDLFHFESLDDGASGNRRVKISISTIRKSINPQSDYGTFTVLVRDFYDTDTDMKILEQYPLCTLDPKDENYVANKIGDLNVYYNFDAETESERRLNISGKRPNKSRYVRIVMNSLVEDGNIPASALPFGFRGLPVLKTSDTLTDSDTYLSMGSLDGGAGGKTRRLAMCDLLAGVRHSDPAGGTADAKGDPSEPLTGSILPPIPFRFKATRGAVESKATITITGEPGKTELADNRYFWGVKFERTPLTGTMGSAILNANASSTHNKLITSYTKFLGIQKLDNLVTGSGADAFNNNKFTLARVALANTFNLTSTINEQIDAAITGAAPTHMREACYIRNGKVETKNYTIVDGSFRRATFASLAAATSSVYFNKFTDYMKFSNFLYGGYDGVNILDRDQRLMNDRATSVEQGGKADGSALGYINLHSDSSPGSAKNNNAIASYRAAARIITDPMASRVNVIAVPGIRDSYVSDYVADLTKTYSKAIYIMDIPGYDQNAVRLFDGSSGRPSVDKTIEQFDGRNFDNNYSATYFPDVMLSVNGPVIGLPASVAAIGALGYNDSVAYPWFAPAGFNRGGLANVVNTEIRLNTEDRNNLYESRINPIANFTNGAESRFVIFGQKTLQQNRSALDRVNVRRMLLEVKRIISDIANKLIFEQNTPETRARFTAQVTPQLASIQIQQGIDQFKVVMDSSNNTSEDIEQNRLNGRIILVPTRAVEFIAIDFIITNSGVSFE